MSACSVLLVAASIVAIEGGMAIIDAGEDRLLQTGDAGQAYYELRVEAIDGLDLPELAAQMDESLAALNVEYESKRQSGPQTSTARLGVKFAGREFQRRRGP